MSAQMTEVKGGDLTSLLAPLEQLVGEAAALLASMQAGPRAVSRKELRDVVTDADLAAERLLLDGLRKLTPDADILSEEAGASDGAHTESDHFWGQGKLRWVIDPLDGTINYAGGLPLFSATVAGQIDGETVLGVVHAPRFPLIGRFLRGASSEASVAEVNGLPARVSQTKELADAIVSVSLTSNYGPEEVRRTSEIIQRLANRARGVRVVVSGALEMSLVAAGQFDAFVALGADLVSHAASMALVRAAGGKATDLSGKEAADEDRERVVSNGLIHDEILSIISNV
ncbi:inositol monophosphatase family protein [Pseudochelatococcus sp. G4_1912]|uniref:inositol monophosphatase family protein n=1 Tax=Pseudochelatococcus sp. G4_1912 TaxID=3114288 RepID=UPI0039C6AFAF